MEIFAGRPAPIQVNYLGCRPPWGRPISITFIADRTVIPDQERKFYTKAWSICLTPTGPPTTPGSGARNPQPRRMRPAGAGICLCNFNQSYKLMPFMFDSWMRILAQVEGSVLWLSECYDAFPETCRPRPNAASLSRTPDLAPALSMTGICATEGGGSVAGIPYPITPTPPPATCCVWVCRWSPAPHDVSGRVAASLLGAWRCLN